MRLAAGVFTVAFCLQRNAQTALDILQRNSARDTRMSDEEDKEKYTLSYSIIQFLVAASLWPVLRLPMQDASQGRILVDVLKLEDKYNDQYVRFALWGIFSGVQFFDLSYRLPATLPLLLL